MGKRLHSPLFLLASVLVLAACTSTSNSGSSATASPTSDGIGAGYRSNVDEISPLVITALAPDPIPVTGTDGKIHVAYELQVLNASPLPATLVQLETLQDGPDGKVLSSSSAPEIASRTLLVGAPTFGLAKEIPGGRVGILLEDDVYPTRADVPERVTHRVSATFRGDHTKKASLTNFFPTKATDIGGAVTASPGSPPVIGPPLAGDGWIAGAACCNFSSHRGSMLPFGGRINGAERFAIDYLKVDSNAKSIVDTQTGKVATFSGDRTKNASYRAWDQPILAVADGTVVKVVSDAPDIAPGALPESTPIGEATGNRIIVDIGNGVYALFAHLKQGSPTVKAGDRVSRGQVIGRVGNSGNTSEAHLHFQLARAVASLTGDNVPFEIDSLDYVGVVTATGELDRSAAGPRTNQLPLAESMTNYPKP